MFNAKTTPSLMFAFACGFIVGVAFLTATGCGDNIPADDDAPDLGTLTSTGPCADLPRTVNSCGGGLAECYVHDGRQTYCTVETTPAQGQADVLLCVPSCP